MSFRPRMELRQSIALLALINCLVATYLHLWKLGLTGPLTCGPTHGCDVVQRSSWGWFLGIDVALIGAVGYAGLLALALWGLWSAKGRQSRNLSLALVAWGVLAVVFTLRLKWAEFVILRSFCPWCAISAVSVVLIVGLAWRDLRAWPQGS